MIHFTIIIRTDSTAKHHRLRKFANHSSIKSIISDMHHRITYMYINFQQNRVSISIKTVHTNLFAKYRKLHKFATTNSFEKKSISSNMHHRKT